MEKVIKREIRCGGLSIKREEGEAPSRTIRGRAIVFNQYTELWRDGNRIVREMIAPSAVTVDLLDKSDIKMTMFHNPQKVLARSKMGKGTLRYELNAEGVDFEFEAPNTPDGDTALEMVARGDIDGCSFWALVDPDTITRTMSQDGGVETVTLTITRMEEIEDFTITHSPAYKQTDVEVMKRDLCSIATPDEEKEDSPSREEIERQKAMVAEWERVERMSKEY